MAEIVTAVGQARQSQELLSRLGLLPDSAWVTGVGSDRRDVSLEFRPAWAVLAASDVQLSIAQTEVLGSLMETRVEFAGQRQCGRITRPEPALELVRLVTQMLKARAMRKTANWHSDAPHGMPGVRRTRARRSETDLVTRLGRARPSRRTRGAPSAPNHSVTR